MTKNNFFLKFYERRDKYRYLIKKGASGENKVTRDLSFSAIEKFNGYEIIKRGLRNKEKEDFCPIDIVYELVSNKDDLAICRFTDEIYLAFRSYISKKIKGEEKMRLNTVRQCHYCENYFSKTKEATKKRTKICAAKEGIVYTVENGKIIYFQDNFKYLGDVPFTVYFDFETTTCDIVFSDPKMFVVSYCQIYSFHLSLTLEKIVIFRSFQQSPEETDLNHFKQEHVSFFKRITFCQLKDAATALLAREKSTSLAELFSVELKFTIDTLNSCFSNTIKAKFLDLDDIKKQVFIKENPFVPSKSYLLYLWVFTRYWGLWRTPAGIRFY